MFSSFSLSAVMISYIGLLKPKFLPPCSFSADDIACTLLRPQKPSDGNRCQPPNLQTSLHLSLCSLPCQLVPLVEHPCFPVLPFQGCCSWKKFPPLPLASVMSLSIDLVPPGCKYALEAYVLIDENKISFEYSFLARTHFSPLPESGLRSLSLLVHDSSLLNSSVQASVSTAMLRSSMPKRAWPHIANPVLSHCFWLGPLCSIWQHEVLFSSVGCCDFIISCFSSVSLVMLFPTALLTSSLRKLCQCVY